jgi:hypothetical protein
MRVEQLKLREVNRFAFSVGAELESVHMYVHYPCNSYVCDSYLWVQ